MAKPRTRTCLIVHVDDNHDGHHFKVFAGPKGNDERVRARAVECARSEAKRRYYGRGEIAEHGDPDDASFKIEYGSPEDADCIYIEEAVLEDGVK